MGIFSGWIMMPLGILFVFSGLIINLLQVGTLLLLFPFSLNAYRRTNIILMELLWSELVWLMDWWAGVKIRVYVDSETWNYMGNEHALVIANHRSDVDWLVGWVMAQRVGCLGSTRAVMKKSTKFLPVIGWSMWFSEYIFLERNWAKDENKLKSSFMSLEGFPRPFWLALFVEGTRFTQAKLQAAQEYAISAGLPIPRNVLIPRTKGFVSAVANFRSFVPAVYDMTVTVPKEGPSTTMLRLFKGQPSVIHLHVRRFPMTELPKEEDDIAHWCRDIFVAKDAFLDKHKEKDSFGEELYKSIPRSSKPLIITMGWSALLLYALAPLLMPLLSTWTGVAWIAGGLVTVFSLMQFFILFTQSERSTPANPISSTTKANKKIN